MRDKDGINRKLFLLDEVYETFSYGKIVQTIIDFEAIKEELDANIIFLEDLEVMLGGQGEDITETNELARILGIQRLYLIENINTFKDAFSLYEDKLVKKINLSESDGLGEISSN